MLNSDDYSNSHDSQPQHSQGRQVNYGYDQQAQYGYDQQQPQYGYDQQAQYGYDQQQQYGYDQQQQYGYDQQQPQYGYDQQQPQYGYDQQQPQYGYDQQQPQYGYDQQQPQYGYDQLPQYGYDQQPQYGYDQQLQYGYDQQAQYGYDQQQPQYGYDQQQPQYGYDQQQPQYGYDQQQPQYGYDQTAQGAAIEPYEPVTAEYHDGGEPPSFEAASGGEQGGKKSKGGKQKRRPRAMLIVGLALMAVGVVSFLFPIAQKAYLAYIMELDANSFLKRLGARDNFQLIDESTLPIAEVIELPTQYVDDAYSGEDETDYYNADGTVRADAGAASTRDKPDPYAILEIPKINLKIGMYTSNPFKQIYQRMRYGAGIYPGSAMPGTIGNCAVAAHRTGPSDFFRRLDELEPGDSMIIHAEDASYKYIVEDVWIIVPSDTSVIKATDYAALTLTTCQAYKGVSNGRRLIVRGRLKEMASDESGAAPAQSERPSAAAMAAGHAALQRLLKGKAVQSVFREAELLR